jgi:hypothetical protein
MNHYSRREFLKFGAALPLALQSLDLRAATASAIKVTPKRIIFICKRVGGVPVGNVTGNFAFGFPFAQGASAINLCTSAKMNGQKQGGRIP